MGKQGFGIDPERLSDYASQIKEVHEMGVQIGIVIGGGNIFRGLSGAGKGFDRVKGDQMGMCATVINSLALRLRTRCNRREEQGAHGHPHGAYRRVLLEVESHRGDGGRLCVHIQCRHGLSLLHY